MTEQEIVKNGTPEIRINVRVPEEEKNELREVSELSGLSETLIVRSAVKKKVAQIRRQLAAGKVRTPVDVI